MNPFGRCLAATKAHLARAVIGNSVPLHPMVLLIIIPTFYGYFIGGIPHFQTYPFLSYFYLISIHLNLLFDGKTQMFEAF